MNVRYVEACWQSVKCMLCFSGPGESSSRSLPKFEEIGGERQIIYIGREKCLPFTQILLDKLSRLQRNYALRNLLMGETDDQRITVSLNDLLIYNKGVTTETLVFIK